MADCIDTEIMPQLTSTLPAILLLVKTAPMMGLLGTVVGMILAFGKIAGATKVDPSALANDIGMALFTTAEGLFIAIPLIIFYSVFRTRIDRFEIQLQRASQEALRLLPQVCGRGQTA
jgi:biopolymer transport protein ExbB/TolQ